MTRRLVDVVQDIIVKEDDCGSMAGLKVSEVTDAKSGSVVESLYDRIVGRYAAKRVINPDTKAVMCEKDGEIT